MILAHECDPTLGGCEFSSFFQTTPQDLIADGLYSRVAVAFHTGQHRAVSLCLLARELGAVRYRTKWALKSRGHAAVDAANLHPGAALVFSRNSSGASFRAAPLVEAEHLTRASSCLDGPFVDPPGNEGSAPEGEGRSGRLSLARGQLVASGTDPDLALLYHHARTNFGSQLPSFGAEAGNTSGANPDGLAQARQADVEMRV